MNGLGAVERRRRNLRILLFAIILGTLPLYCLGFLLWGTAPQRSRTPTSAPTITIVAATQAATATTNGLPSVTPFQFSTLPPILPPTPQSPILPPVTRYLSPTPQLATATFFVFPTSTPAPTLTLFPSSTPIPIPSDTPIPIPSNTSIPVPTNTSIPVATNTDTPTPTPTATDGEASPIPFS